MIDIIALAGVVLFFNLMPAFAPPTWAALVLFSLNTNLHPIVIVAVGAVCAGTGVIYLHALPAYFEIGLVKTLCLTWKRLKLS